MYKFLRRKLDVTFKKNLCDLDESQMRYVDRIAYLVCRPSRFSCIEMSKVLDHLYLASYDNAIEIDKLKENGITHVLNTVEETYGSCSTGSAFYGDQFKYYGFTSDDQEDYPIMNHFEDTYTFIEEARKSNGKCLIHCMQGINRSGALTVAYVMVHHNIGPIAAARLVFQARGMILTNTGFIARLVRLAIDKNLLTKDVDDELMREKANDKQKVLTCVNKEEGIEL